MSDSEDEVSFESVEEADGKISDAGASGPDGNLTDDPKPAVEETVGETACAKSTSAESEEKPVASEPAEKLACNSSITTAEPNVVTSEGHRPDVSTALDKLVEDDESGWSWGNWSSWGSSVLNTAASSVGTFTTQVGEGLYQVLETVESGLLAVDETDDNDDDASRREPDTSAAESNDSETVVSQEMVRHGGVDDGATEAAAVKEQELESQDDKSAESRDGWLSGWKLPVLSEVVDKTSSIVHQTSNVSMKVIGGGIDVLEAIGRKTYDVLAEGEHGLKKTIVKTRENRPTLSQTLREAKTMAESREQEEEEFVESRKSNFGAQFDDFQGLVQLEALESLSGSSEQKVRRFVDMLPKDAAESLKSELMQIRQVFDGVHADCDDDDVTEHDFVQLITDYFARLNLNAGVQKLLACQAKVKQAVATLESELQQPVGTDNKTSKEIHQMAVQSLAEVTACAIEHLHRVGQQLLIVSLPQQSYRSIADQLASVSRVLCNELSLQSTSFVHCLTAKSKDDVDTSASELITGVYLESSNASDYIRNGFTLLLPVLQLAVIKAHPLFSDTDD